MVLKARRVCAEKERNIILCLYMHHFIHHGWMRASLCVFRSPVCACTEVGDAIIQGAGSKYLANK